MNLPYAVNRWPWAVVEVAADGESEVTRRVRDAYLASRAGVVGLVLRGVTRARVDRMLDDVVDTRDSRLQGVVYLDASDDAVVQAASHAGVVVASTDGFRALLDSRGIVFMDDAAGSELLRVDVAADGRRPFAPPRA